jgi:hypothetical protein|tara:strand:+ start:10280 stop:10513 length:234 start_codon:yes stop_codon:yes gene_type:complete
MVGKYDYRVEVDRSAVCNAVHSTVADHVDAWPLLYVLAMVHGLQIPDSALTKNDIQFVNTDDMAICIAGLDISPVKY